MGIAQTIRTMIGGGPSAGTPVRAVWRDTVLAESDRTVKIEGNHYFPPDAINPDALRPSTHQTVCPWKGTAKYYDVVSGDEVNRAAAWYYPSPKPAAAAITDHVAFWKGVRIEAVD